MSISGTEINLFRSRFCQINSKFIITGVPQGFILGPILFLIYVDTKPENIRSLYFGDRQTIVVFQRFQPVEKTLNHVTQPEYCGVEGTPFKTLRGIRSK